MQFTSDCSRNCNIFISDSHSLLWVQNEVKETPPLLDCGNPDSPLWFIYLCSFLSPGKISGTDATFATHGIWAWGLAGDGWRSIYITLPRASSLFFFPSPHLFFFYLVNMAERAHPEKASWAFKMRAWSEGVTRLWSNPCSVLTTKGFPCQDQHSVCALRKHVGFGTLLTAFWKFYITKCPINKQSIFSMYN